MGVSPMSRTGKPPMPVKHWSRAGLLLTGWCNARCASCYLSCGPDRGDEMTVESAMRFWHGLSEASPHGCRIHLSGGEPFGDWGRLIEVCRQAHRQGLSSPGGKGPLEKVETNAFWATEEAEIRRRLKDLNQAGMIKLGISADPYHQQFVPIERCRRLARVAEEELGAGRVQVRWRDWLASGRDTDGFTSAQRASLFVEYARRGRERFNGRAAQELAEMIRVPEAGFPGKSAGDSADNPCREPLLRSRHVHVDADGRLTPGTCAGIVLGNAAEGIAALWRRLGLDFDRRPIVGTLARGGSAALAKLAAGHGYEPLDGYVSKCHLCWHVRQHLAGRGLFTDELVGRQC